MTALDGVRDRIEALLAGPDAATAARYPGEAAGRQPVHSVYVPADRFDADLPARWGAEALAALDAAGGVGHLLGVHDLVDDPVEAERSGQLVLDKLRSEAHTSELQTRGHRVCGPWPEPAEIGRAHG